MYRIRNTVEDKIIGEFTDAEFIEFVCKIVIENEDYNFSVLGTSDAIEYIEDFCDDLELVEKKFYTISLVLTDQQYHNPLDAVKDFFNTIKEHGHTLIYDVEDEETGEKFTVDLSEKDEFAVIPNNN